MKYSKNIYPKQIILNAIEEYRDISRIEMSEDEKYWILEFHNCCVDETLVVAEFGNYLIDAANGVGVLI